MTGYWRSPASRKRPNKELQYSKQAFTPFAVLRLTVSGVLCGMRRRIYSSQKPYSSDDGRMQEMQHKRIAVGNEATTILPILRDEERRKRERKQPRTAVWCGSGLVDIRKQAC